MEGYSIGRIGGPFARTGPRAQVWQRLAQCLPEKSDHFPVGTLKCGERSNACAWMGRRGCGYVALRVVVDTTESRLTRLPDLVQNWFEELRRLVPTE